jgi:uncharacterized protein YfaS (alpha-2-macroglobulin family)
VEGQRTVVTLKPGDTFDLTLTDRQRTTLGLEIVSGRVAVTAVGRALSDPSTLATSPDLTITRKKVADPIPTDGLVVVEMTATFKPAAPTGCYLVVEQAPSGLAPIEGYLAADEGDEATGPKTVWPSSIVGQEVRFCAYDDPDGDRTVHLRYRARVVNAGSFFWEPAVIQLPEAPELVAVTSSGSVRIGRR